MSDNSGSYRANIRLNRVEYSDLVKDVESFPESERPARLRMLMRVGLAALKGSLMPAANESQPASAQVVQMLSAERPSQSQASRGGLDAHDIDPTSFQFGTPS